MVSDNETVADIVRDVAKDNKPLAERIEKAAYHLVHDLATARRMLVNVLEALEARDVVADPVARCVTLDSWKQMMRDTIAITQDPEVGVAKTETTTKESLGVGNAARMREALAEIRLLLARVLRSIKSDVACGIIAAKAKHALSAPPRNCDVGDAYEQGARFARWRKGEGCDSDPEIVLRWAQMPYKPEGESNEGK